MNIIRYEQQYAAQIAALLNNYLPFEPEDATTVDDAGGIRYICIEDGEVIGYIAGYVMSDSYKEFPYFEATLAPLHQKIASKTTLYTSHFVVNPNFRKRGIGTALVDAYMNEAKQQADAVVVVGWVQSDTNVWAAERQFMQFNFEQEAYIQRYFEPYNVYCPSCDGTCYCDANILYMEV